MILDDPSISRRIGRRYLILLDSFEVEVQDKYQQSDNSKNDTSKHEEVSFVPNDQYMVPLPNIMNLILEIYKYLKKSMVKKDVRIITLE